MSIIPSNVYVDRSCLLDQREKEKYIPLHSSHQYHYYRLLERHKKRLEEISMRKMDRSNRVTSEKEIGFRLNENKKHIHEIQ